MSYANPDDIFVFESGNSYANPARRCGCGSPIARTSSLHCCHVCYARERDVQVSGMGNGGRMVPRRLDKRMSDGRTR